jgi:hypothetical protein
LQRGVSAFVVAAGIDFDFEYGDVGEVDGVVLDFRCGTSGAEGPLLTNDLAFLPVGDGGDAEFLGALVLGLMEFETDAADILGLIEFEADSLRAGVGGFPAFGFSAKGVLEGVSRIFRGDFERGKGLEVEPGVEGGALFGGVDGGEYGFTHGDPQVVRCGKKENGNKLYKARRIMTLPFAVRWRER